MCGIIGYIGKKNALPILLSGLKSMEYRGYDSSGISVINKKGLVEFEKAVGKLNNLENKLRIRIIEGTLGCGHQRWATHGEVTEANAHPHTDCTQKIWISHNGIIENYKELRDELKKSGHVFKSETDTEIIAHLIEEFERGKRKKLEEAVRMTLKKIKGAYALVIFDAKEPGILIAARNFSPLVLGIGNGEHFVASDPSAILKFTSQVVYLDDREMAILTPKGYRVCDFSSNHVEKESHIIDWDPEEAQKGGFPHFLLKEISEGPAAVHNSIRGRLVPEEGLARLGGLADIADKLKSARRIFIAACGTAYHAGKIGEYMIEEYAGIPVEVEYSSEFRYRKPIFSENDIFLAISQSGETADTLAALREAKEKGILSLGIINVVGSTIARETDAGVYQHVGPEMSVASTKAFVSQISILALLSLLLGRSRNMSLVTGRRIAEELTRIPALMKRIIENQEGIKKLAEKYSDFNNFFYVGRKYNFPVAEEGALKLKEISYIHAEAYCSGELKHGPIAVIDKKFPTVAIVPQDSVYEKMLSNIEEIKARGGPILAIATEGDKRIKELARDVIFIPKTLEMLTPLLSTVPLQLFAYYVAVLRGNDVDQPRNLAKSVTVE